MGTSVDLIPIESSVPAPSASNSLTDEATGVNMPVATPSDVITKMATPGDLLTIDEPKTVIQTMVDDSQKSLPSASLNDIQIISYCMLFALGIIAGLLLVRCFRVFL